MTGTRHNTTTNSPTIAITESGDQTKSSATERGLNAADRIILIYRMISPSKHHSMDKKCALVLNVFVLWLM